jgi:hypothetical protein
MKGQEREERAVWPEREHEDWIREDSYRGEVVDKMDEVMPSLGRTRGRRRWDEERGTFGKGC